jgi:hypothetical protein
MTRTLRFVHPILALLWRSIPEADYALLLHLLRQGGEDGERLITAYFTGTKRVARMPPAGHIARVYPTGEGWLGYAHNVQEDTDGDDDGAPHGG